MQQERIDRLRILSAELHEIAKKLGPDSGTLRMDRQLLQKKCMEIYEEIFLLEDHAPALTITDHEPLPPVAEPVILPASEDPNLVASAEPEIKEPVAEDLPAAEPATPITEETEEPEAEEITAAEEEPEVIEAAPVQPGLFAETAPVEKQEEEKPPPPQVSQPEEKLHERISRSLHGHAHHMESRVESLKSAISLNKKIAFVNELFRENTVEYAKAIEKLNTATDRNEALRYFSELKHGYGWDNNNELVKDLENMIIKRYA